MDAVGVNVIETATLGRPFQLGMLYDCRKDALVPGITLWGEEQLQQSIRSHAKMNTNFNVIASDSIEEKSNSLNIDGSLKLSLLSGLINVSGAAKYLSDTKKSFKQQRLTLHYHSTTKFEELTMNHLASGNIAHYEAFDNDAATHVVTAVLYGANACFVFDREVSSDEDKTTIEGEVKATFDKLKGISLGAEIDLNMNDNQKTAVQKFSCTFYGDFQLPSNPTSFEDALKIFADLPKLLGEKKELSVPLRVWLYPLDKLHTSVAKVQKDISTGLIKAVESVFESLSTTEMKCGDLQKEPTALAFAAFYGQIMQMRENCCSYKFSLMKKLGSLLPEIRGDQKKETELNDLLRDHIESPFRHQDLEQWVKEKEKESGIIKTLIRQLNVYGAKVEVNLDEILMDLEVEHLVSYTFTSFEGPDVLLSTQKDYLSPKGPKKESAPSAKWMTGLSSDAKMNIRTNKTIFKNLINSKQRKPAKFIVASKEKKNIPGSCILLYENGSDEDIVFTPPLKPASPVIEQIKCHSLVLQVPKTCQATEDLRLMYKIKEDKDWKSLHVQQSKDTVTLTDLSPDTQYDVKYTAIGKLNYTIDSDVIHITVIDKKLLSATESVLESLTLNEKRCSELMDDSRSKIFSAFNRKIQDMMKHCQTYRQDFITRIQSLINSIQACEKGICDLKDLLQAHEESNFKAISLTEWITIKEKELNVVTGILQQLQDSGAEDRNNLDEILSDINVENVLCYTFTSLEKPDELLSDLENDLKHQMIRRDFEKMPNAVSRTWLQGTVRKKMREHLQIFKDIMTSHGSRSTKFLVSSKDHRIHPGSCILLYENGSHEALCFTPPSKPVCPIIIQVRGHSVVFKMPSSCPVTVELKLLYKMKEEREWKSQHVHKSQETVTLEDLSPDTQYEVKYTAVGKLNYTTDSDAIIVEEV
ncbi:Stonustoxin subunit beta [Triplophysa tibetana]|uniref:Stonustoxin subunit beta n=1 Tax=Triplophysa tibetana TaxID=1572043 RepID=A0A5A9P2D8_9TELE|nr:Stonustoxin subunit beta [Triplophysa tibetana]